MKTQNSQNKVIKAGAGYVIGNYLLKGITFFSAPIFVRLLSKEDYGRFGTYTSYENILYIIIGLALHSSITNAKYDYKEKFDEYVSSLVMLVGFSTLVWLILANIFYDSFNFIFDFSRVIINILILHCFGTAMFQFFNTYVSLNYSVKSFLKLTSINALSNMGLSIVLILTFFTNSRLLGRILGASIPLFLIGVYIVSYFFKKAKPVTNLDYWKYGLRYSLPIIPHGISQVILSSFDRIMIDKMIGAASAGIYNFAYTIYTLVLVVSTSLDKVWKPWFYERMNEKDYETISKQGEKYATGMALFTSLVVMVAPEIVIILGTREYIESTLSVVPILIGGYYAYLYSLPVLIEYYYGKTKYIAMGTIIAAGMNIILNYFFINSYGYIAAAYTTLVTYFAYFLFHFVLAKKIHGSSLFSTEKLFSICFILLIIGGVSIALQEHIIIRWILEIVLGIISLYWAEKNFQISKIVKKKLGKN